MGKRSLKMKFAGRFIDLLGHQMYGGPVQAVAELIANSWDADAERVQITLPNDITTKDAEIIVKDYGQGMSFDEVNDCYLNIGYERRIRGERTPKNRLVMGRKGIGKLAGFGIAENIVIHSVKDKHLVEFNLNYSELKSKKSLEGFEFLPEKDADSDEPNGVTIIYKGLRVKQNINIDNFRNSISRRFAMETGKMGIIINEVLLTKENLDFEFRTSDKGWIEEDLPGFGKISYWFGFLKSTIQDPELRGVSVFARERIAQTTPFFFNLTGGINGQVGLEYLTGQVKSDDLDSDIDYIATDRQTINWQFGSAPVFEKWGQDKIKELCRDWKKRREEENLKKFKHSYSEFFPLINNLPDQEKKDLMDALEKIAKLDHVDPKDFEVIAGSLVSGAQRVSIKKVIKRIIESSSDALPELLDAIKEWNVITAVMAAESIAGKIEIVNKFKMLIDQRTKEKSLKGKIDMQTFIKDYPWLLGPEYENFESQDFYHEKAIDKWISDKLNKVDKEFKKGKEGRRFDLVVVKNSWRIIVIELMRPGELADMDHANRLINYVTRIKDAANSMGTQEEFQKVSVYGLLIADGYSVSQSLKEFIQNNRNLIDAIEWKGLFNRAEVRYKEFFEMLKTKAPDDPRIKNLENLSTAKE